MSSSDSCIVYSVKGFLTWNRELERLLNELVDGLPADHRRTEMHPRQHVLDRLREELVGGLQHLERVHVGLAVISHDELRLNLSGDSGALEHRGILRLRAVLQHLRRL